MFFEGIHICPECNSKQKFFVAEPGKDEIITYSMDIDCIKANGWKKFENEVIVTFKCKECWKTSKARYTVTGKYIGEYKNGNTSI